MRLYRAAWVLPITEPPIQNGWVAVHDGRIVTFGRREVADRSDADTRDLGNVAIMPGLVNAHTHLELSYLRGVIPPASTFVGWVRNLIGLRRNPFESAEAEHLPYIEEGIAEATASGTALVGDISNTLTTFEPLKRSPLAALVFYELFNFIEPEPDRFVDRACKEIDALTPTETVRVSLAAHAPYSVAPLLFGAIRRAVDLRPFMPVSVHLSESAEEVEFIATGTGPWRKLREDIGAMDQEWVPPGVSPVQYLDDNGFLKGRVIVVHGVQMNRDDLARLVRQDATLVTCPRSNKLTGAGTPPIADFYASGVRVAVGTDSLASAPDLNLFSEVAAMHAIAPSIPAATLLDSATLQGARALGFESEFGSIEPGKRARLLAVSIPPRTADVEEYLVSGIERDRLAWIGETAP